MQQTPFLIWLLRIASVALLILLGLVTTALVLPFCSQPIRLRIINVWCKSLIKSFNIKVTTHGKLPDVKTANTMFVANHISWTDIHILNSIIPVRFIAKIEIQSWPVFGYLVSKSGTLFINRSIRKDAARIVELTTNSLKNGDNVCLFPEGTTTEGTQVLPFKSSIIQAAVDAKAMIWPAVIHYPLADGKPNIGMAFAGETNMVESMKLILNMRNPVVELHFLSPFSCVGHDRHSASKLAYSLILEQFNHLIKV